MITINLVDDGVPLRSIAVSSRQVFLLAHRVEEFGINELWIRVHPGPLQKEGYVIPEGLIPVVRIQDGIIRLDGEYYKVIPISGKFVLSY